MSICTLSCMYLGAVFKAITNIKAINQIKYYIRDLDSKSENQKWQNLTRSKKLRTTCLCFRLVSPSSVAVSMWQRRSGSLELSSSTSAGRISLQRSLMKSPTRTSFQNFSTYRRSALEGITHREREAVSRANKLKCSVTEHHLWFTQPLDAVGYAASLFFLRRINKCLSEPGRNGSTLTGKSLWLILFNADQRAWATPQRPPGPESYVHNDHGAGTILVSQKF